MVHVRSTTRLFVRSRLAAFLVAVAGGCTMCPDPLDYSGPVPNGSSPQNDFRARSGGILPLGGAPRPWPQVVRADEDRADGASGSGEDATVETVSVLQPAAAVTEDASVARPDEASAALPPEAALEPVPAEGKVEDQAPEPAATPPEPAPSEGAVAEPGPSTPSPPAGETPGWRPRR